MRKATVLLSTAATVAALAAPALGATTADTTLTVNLVGGSLSISAPSTASLSGSAAAGTIITGSLGSSDTTVTDGRGSLLGWGVTAVTDGDLETLSTANADKIALSAAGPLTIVGGTVTAGGSSLLTGVSVGALGGLSTTPVTLVTAALGAGGGTYTFRPTLALTVPPNTVAHSDYTVKITQTVS